MFQSLSKLLFGAVLFGLALMPGTASAQVQQRPRKVSDEAGLFSADAKSDANTVIADIKKRHKKDLFIETRESIPMGAEIGKWAKTHADELGVDGVYVVITTKPKKFEVYVGNKTREKYFVTENRDRVMELLKKNLGKKPDQALEDVAHYTQETMDKNVAGAVAPPKERPQGKRKAGELAPAPAPAPVIHGGGEKPSLLSTILPWVCLIVGVLVVVWVIFAIIRALTSFGGGGGGGYGYGGGGYGGGGGGLFTGMLGGLFGAMAGMWIYNNMFGGHATYGSNGAVDWGGGSSASGDASAPYEADTGGTTAGDDWGDDKDGGGGADAGGGGEWGGDAGGAGDAGGGDAGGGDWGGGGGGDAGGGDWGGGGGGGDFGGGGGDFGGGGGGDW